MNKHITLAFLLCMGSFLASAQQFAVGVRGGANVTTISGASEHENGFRGDNKGTYLAYYGGVTTQFEILARTLYLQPEVNYMQKGVKYKSNDNFSTLKLDYIELPVFLKAAFDFSRVTQTKMVFGLGPSVSYLLNEKVTISENGEVREMTANDLKTKKFDFGLNLMTGFEIPVGKGAISLDFRYGVGLNSLFPFDEIHTRKNNYNIVGSIGVGYMHYFGEPSSAKKDKKLKDLKKGAEEKDTKRNQKKDEKELKKEKKSKKGKKNKKGKK